MFTGIIESIGTIQKIISSEANLHFEVASDLSDELKIDQSLAHDGVCLTVVKLHPGGHVVTAIAETLAKTSLSSLREGDTINLERALRLGSRLDGHFVQGHVDATGQCVAKHDAAGSHVFTFSFPDQYAPLLIEKGSICVNGVSLTAFDITDSRFSVAVIPYTYTHTTFGRLQSGALVNLEFDILGKYFLRRESLKTVVR